MTTKSKKTGIFKKRHLILDAVEQFFDEPTEGR